MHRGVISFPGKTEEGTLRFNRDGGPWPCTLWDAIVDPYFDYLKMAKHGMEGPQNHFQTAVAKVAP